MTRSIASELLLLATDEESGKSLTDSTTLNAALAGTAMLELVMAGALDVARDDAAPVKKERLFRTGRNQPTDPLLAEMAEVCENKKPKDAVNALSSYSFSNRGNKLREQLLDQLVAEGVLSHERGKVLGLFPTDRWPEADPRVEAEIRGRVRAVLVDGEQPDERTAALVSMVSATKLAPKLFPDQDKKALQQRADAVRESDWAGTAVTDAVNEVMMVMMVSVFIPIFVSTSG